MQSGWSLDNQEDDNRMLARFWYPRLCRLCLFTLTPDIAVDTLRPSFLVSGPEMWLLNASSWLDSVSSLFNASPWLHTVSGLLNATSQLHSMSSLLNASSQLRNVSSLLNATSQLHNVSSLLNASSRLHNVNGLLNASSLSHGVSSLLNASSWLHDMSSFLNAISWLHDVSSFLNASSLLHSVSSLLNASSWSHSVSSMLNASSLSHSMSSFLNAISWLHDVSSLHTQHSNYWPVLSSLPQLQRWQLAVRVLCICKRKGIETDFDGVVVGGWWWLFLRMQKLGEKVLRVILCFVFPLSWDRFAHTNFTLWGQGRSWMSIPQWVACKLVSVMVSHTVPGQHRQPTPTLLGHGVYACLAATCHLHFWQVCTGAPPLPIPDLPITSPALQCCTSPPPTPYPLITSPVL